MAKMSFDHGGRRCIRPILEQYQSGIDKMLDFEFHVVGKCWKMENFESLTIFFDKLSIYMLASIVYPDKGESEGYTVKCKEKDFPISNYPLEQTEFFYAQKQARDKLENEKNKEFDYSMFHHRKCIA